MITIFVYFEEPIILNNWLLRNLWSLACKFWMNRASCSSLDRHFVELLQLIQSAMPLIKYFEEIDHFHRYFFNVFFVELGLVNLKNGLDLLSVGAGALLHLHAPFHLGCQRLILIEVGHILEIFF